MISPMFAGFLAPFLAILWFSSSGATSPSGAALAPAADTPNPWFTLGRYDRTMTRAEFEEALRLYDPFHGLAAYMEIDDAGVTLYPSPTDHRVPQFHLDFASDPATAKAAPLLYRTPEQFRALRRPETKPLAGLRIAIDPGHIGGEWGQVEDRSIYYFGIGRIQEGDMNLITAGLLKQRLADLGAEVFLTRHDAQPVTSVRPEQLREEAVETMIQMRPELAGLPPERQRAEIETMPSRIELMTHLLFERKYEFLARGSKIRQEFNPDLTVVLYINATPSSGRGHLVGVNQNIFFVDGAFAAAEVAIDDERQRLFYKVLDRVSPVEYEVAARIAEAFKRTTGLGPVEYGDSPTTRLIDPDNFYVVARNLGANRQYDGPVVTTEPFFMNNRTTAERLAAGDYEGERLFDGHSYPSIFREYADCVVQGLLESYGGVQPPAPEPKMAANPAPAPPATTPE